MVHIHLGLSGSGKTKEMIREINEAADQATGSVVCIEKGNKLRYDVNYRVRLIEYGVYGLQGAEALKAFISGLHAGNFDITHVFLKSIHRLLGTDAFRLGCSAEELIAAHAPKIEAFTREVQPFLLY